MLWRQLISEEGVVKESGGAPQRSETAHSDTHRNLILPLDCIQPDDLSPEIPEKTPGFAVEESTAKAHSSMC